MVKKKDNLQITTDEGAMPAKLLPDLIKIIEGSKKTLYRQVNSGVVLLFWEVGKRINKEILQNERAEYGKQIVVTVSRQLEKKYGSSFEEKNLRRMMQFASQFEDTKIVLSLLTQLSWSHILSLLPLKAANEKLYYAEEAIKCNLGVRDLRHLISRKSYERRDIANLKLSNQSKVPFNVFKDPYLLDILDLKENFLEADLEKAIITELEKFILEFGHGFSFIERQKRITFDGRDYVIDLLFFNRELRRLVAVELKLGEFKTEYFGQMTGYLRLLNEFERKAGEERPIGIILCTGASRRMVELLEMDKAGIAVSEYWTKLPQRDHLEQKLKEIIAEARERLERCNLQPENTKSKRLQYFIEPKPDDYPDED